MQYCEKRDPDFDSKMHDILVVYKQISLQFNESGTLKPFEGTPVHTLSYDEKPEIQAIDSTVQDRLPILLVSLTHKSSDFVRFLGLLDKKYPEGDKISLILDNHSAHTSKEPLEYLNTVPGRFEFVFPPTHGSWLNMVEGFFSKLTKQMLSGIRVSSREELEERIYQYFTEINEVPVPYHFSYKLDDIDLEKEDISQIVYEVVNHKAAKACDKDKRAPKPRKRTKQNQDDKG